MEALMWRPSSAELAAAVGHRAPSRPSPHASPAKERHTRAMREIVMSTPDLPRGLSFSKQRELALRDFIGRVPELAATAGSISTKSLKAVVAQMSEVPLPPQHVSVARRRPRYPPLPPMPPLNIPQTLMASIGFSTHRQDYAYRFVFNPGKHPGATIKRPLLIADDDDDVTLPPSKVSGEQLRYPLRHQVHHPTWHSIIANDAHVNQSARSTTLVPYQAPRVEPVDRSGTSTQLALGTHRELAIEIDPEDEEQPLRIQAAQSGPVPSMQHYLMGTAVPQEEQGGQLQGDLRWHYYGPAVPSQHSRPSEQFVPAVASRIRPLTRKERKAVAKAAAPPAKVHKHRSGKNKAQQQQLEQKKRKEKQMPHISAGSRKAKVSTQTSQVRQHFFARAKNEIHTDHRPYSIVIEAMEGAVTDLKTEALLYQAEQRTPTVPSALQPSQDLSEPPVTAVSRRQPEAQTTSTRKFWKLPVKFVAAGMAALKHHMDHVDSCDVHSTTQNQDVGGDARQE